VSNSNQQQNHLSLGIHGLLITLAVILSVGFILNMVQSRRESLIYEQRYATAAIEEDLRYWIHAFEHSVTRFIEDGKWYSTAHKNNEHFSLETIETSSSKLPPRADLVLNKILAERGVRVMADGRTALAIQWEGTSQDRQFGSLRWNLAFTDQLIEKTANQNVSLLTNNQHLQMIGPSIPEIQHLSGRDSIPPFGIVSSGGGSYAYALWESEFGISIVFARSLNLFTLVPWMAIVMVGSLFALVVYILGSQQLIMTMISKGPVISREHFLKAMDDQEISTGFSNAVRFLSHRKLEFHRQISVSLNTIHAGLVVFSRGVVVFANRAAAEILERPATGIMTLDSDVVLAYLIDENGMKASMDRLQSSDGENEVFWYRISGLNSDRWVNASLSNLSLNKRDYQVLTLIDQSRVHHYQSQVDEQNRFMNSILEAISDPFYVIETGERRVVMANSAAQEIIDGKRFTTCQALNPRSTICSNKNQLCPYELSKLTKVSSLVERVQQDTEGNVRYYEIHGHPVVDENDTVSHVIEYQLEVTQRKRAEKSLRESEERYSSLFEKNTSIMLLYDPESGRIVDANPAACVYYGYSRAEFIQKHIVDINTMSPFDLYREMQQAKQEGRHQLYFQHKLASGEVRDVESYSGLLKVGDQDLYYSLIYDITDRRRAQREVQNLLDLEALIAAISTRFIRLQAKEIDHQIKESLVEIGQFADYERCLLFTVSADCSQVVDSYEWHTMERDSVAPRLHAMSSEHLSWLKTKIGKTTGIYNYDIRNSTAYRMHELQFWKHFGVDVCYFALFQVSDGEIGVLVFEELPESLAKIETSDAFMRIIAELFSSALEKKQYEQRLIENQSVLKSLSSHIHDEIEAVRSSIAREVHDELGQLLTALKFDVRWVQKRVAGFDETKAIEAKLGEMGTVIDHAVASVQRITAELRPILLDDLGLGPAIEWHARQFSERTGITVDLEIEEVDASSQASTTLFRVCQEALTNIARHSQATTVTVTLRREPGRLRMRIDDNGVGITREQIHSNKSFGIIGVRERVQSIGGDVAISGSLNEGTSIDVKIPKQ